MSAAENILSLLVGMGKYAGNNPLDPSNQGNPTDPYNVANAGQVAASAGGMGALDAYNQHLKLMQMANNPDTQKQDFGKTQAGIASATGNPNDIRMSALARLSGIGNPAGNASSTMSQSDQQFQQAYNLAMMSGDMGKASAVLQSWAEHNPKLAGAIETEKANAGITKDANGNIVRAGSAVGGGGLNSPKGGPVNLPGASDQGKFQIPMASDGKTVLPKMNNLFKPDPTGTPKYKTDNTETGVAQTKQFITDDAKANTEMNGSLSSMQTEQFRLKELADIYHKVQAGTLTAQNPELANKLAAWGVMPEGGVKDLNGVQAALQNHILQIIGQIKDTNANMGGAPTRVFGAEIRQLLDEGENPGNQPGGLQRVISEAKGIVDHHIDMINGWNGIGGLGNRAANGYTMRPDDYVRNWSLNHNISDYKDAASKEIGEFKGQSPTKLNPQDIVNELRKRGHKIE